jgi:hypothetical protein
VEYPGCWQQGAGQQPVLDQRLEIFQMFAQFRQAKSCPFAGGDQEGGGAGPGD